MTKELWVVGEVVKKMPVTVNGKADELEMKWADGMFGVIPVFKSAAYAKAYAGKKRAVWPVEQVGSIEKVLFQGERMVIQDGDDGKE